MTYTVAKAERILAEAKAREAVVDYDLERAVISACDAAYREVYGDNVPKLDTPYVKAFVRNFTLPLAPAQQSPAPSEEDDLRLAREVCALHMELSECPNAARMYRDGSWDGTGQISTALAAIRAERKRAGGVKWPSDAELREMAEDVGDTLEPALEMARRLRAYQTGGEAYDKVHAALAADEKKRADDAEAENARLTALVHQIGENAAKAAREYAEGMEGMRGALDVAWQEAHKMRNASKLVGPYPNDPAANRVWARSLYHAGKDLATKLKPFRALKGATPHD